MTNYSLKLTNILIYIILESLSINGVRRISAEITTIKLIPSDIPKIIQRIKVMIEVATDKP